jgi:hypothetical protein
MLRLLLLLGAAVVAVLLLFPEEVALAKAYASEMIGHLAKGATGYYRGMAR